MYQVKRKSAGQRIRFQIGNLAGSEERVWASMDILSALAADENCGPKHFGAGESVPLSPVPAGPGACALPSRDSVGAS